MIIPEYHGPGIAWQARGALNSQRAGWRGSRYERFPGVANVLCRVILEGLGLDYGGMWMAKSPTYDAEPVEALSLLLRKASTTAGSNWVPAQRRSSALASSTVLAGR